MLWISLYLPVLFPFMPIYGDHRYPYMDIHVQYGDMATLVDHCAHIWRALIEICVFGDMGILLHTTVHHSGTVTTGEAAKNIGLGVK